MRQLMLAMVAAFVFVSGTARADTVKTPRLLPHSCGFSTPYNVQVRDDGVRLYCRNGMPKEVAFHDVYCMSTASPKRPVRPMRNGCAR